MTDDLTALRRMAEANARIAEEVGNTSGSISFAPQFFLSLLDRLERAEAAIERAKAEAEKVSREQLVMPPEALILADATLAALDTGKEKNDE